MIDIAAYLEDPATTIAVVGASDDPTKYGSVIYRDLKRKRFTVMAVNPNRSTVDGDPCHQSLGSLPSAPTLVDFVVPPRLTLQHLRSCLELGLMNAWVQPGAESPEVVSFLRENGFNYLTHACIMVEARAL